MKFNYFILYKWHIDIIREDVIIIHIQHIREDLEDIKKFVEIIYFYLYKWLIFMLVQKEVEKDSKWI